MLLKLNSINLIQSKVQTIPFHKIVNKLSENDILFIDSTHTVRPGSDVNYLILEILPRLNPGVIVHFHDIYLPYDYKRSVLENCISNQELNDNLDYRERVEKNITEDPKEYMKK